MAAAPAAASAPRRRRSACVQWVTKIRAVFKWAFTSFKVVALVESGLRAAAAAVAAVAAESALARPHRDCNRENDRNCVDREEKSLPRLALR